MAALPDWENSWQSNFKTKVELRLERWDWGKVMKGVPSDLKNQMPQLARESAVESHALLETAVS